jgi:uncharacterized protein YjaG (DUF416 family)
MAEKLNSIDDYERFLYTTIGGWSPKQRLAIAAAMAERWFPVYEAFSAAEQWGDTPSLRHGLDAVWKHLQGKLLSASEIARYITQVEDSTPHMDDFDDVAALAACVMLSSALECCRRDDNTGPAMQAVISGFEAVAPEWDMDPEEQPKLWRKISIRQEFKKQQKMITEIEAITNFDSATVQSFRKKLKGKDYAGEVPPATAPKGPNTITNQQAFEQYRNMVQSDIKTSDRKWEQEYAPQSYLWAVMVLATWMGRYKRRYDTIKGNYGALADTIAQQALPVRQRAMDGVETALPNWGEELQNTIDMALKNTLNSVDVTNFDQPHGYGPSLRKLWLEGQKTIQPPTDAWRNVVAWARHYPLAWEAEDQRKKRGMAYTNPALGPWMTRELTWRTTDHPEFPWAADLDSDHLQIRLNDFPDAFMYSLIINQNNVGDFHDWPENWQR